jgi:hypothetical protein
MKINLPNWIQEIGIQRNGIILTDDFDSLMSYYLLRKKYPNLTIKGFYTFKELYLLNGKDDISESIFVDCDANINNFKCIGNHRTPDYRDNINLNTSVIGKYNEKYPFSTALTILYLFYSKIEIELLSDEFIKLLIAIDGGYIGWFKDNGRWRDVHIKWLKDMDMYRVLDVLENSVKDDYINILNEYNLNAKLRYDSTSRKFISDLEIFGLLWDLDIDITNIFDTEFEFTGHSTLKTKYVSESQLYDFEKIISWAETYNGKYSISYV